MSRPGGSEQRWCVAARRVIIGPGMGKRYCHACWRGWRVLQKQGMKARCPGVWGGPPASGTARTGGSRTAAQLWSFVACLFCRPHAAGARGARPKRHKPEWVCCQAKPSPQARWCGAGAPRRLQPAARWVVCVCVAQNRAVWRVCKACVRTESKCQQRPPASRCGRFMSRPSKPTPAVFGVWPTVVRQRVREV